MQQLNPIESLKKEEIKEVNEKELEVDEGLKANVNQAEDVLEKIIAIDIKYYHNKKQITAKDANSEDAYFRIADRPSIEAGQATDIFERIKDSENVAEQEGLLRDLNKIYKDFLKKEKFLKDIHDKISGDLGNIDKADRVLEMIKERVGESSADARDANKIMAGIAKSTNHLMQKKGIDSLIEILARAQKHTNEESTREKWVLKGTDKKSSEDGKND